MLIGEAIRRGEKYMLKNYDLKWLDKSISEYCEEKKIFGVMRITCRDKIIFEKNIGYANIETKEHFTEKSVFSFYSLSKPYCVIGLLRLKDLGLVDIDAHPSVYVPEAKGFDKRVTIRHILHHISGLPDFERITEFSEKYKPGYAKFTREHMKLLVNYPQYFEPGTRGFYANINIILCALIIENVTGITYAEYMKKYVFEPLGMKSAVVDNEELFVENRVQGYALKDGEAVAVDKSHDWLLGAGDIVGTVDDVYALNKAIKHRLILSEETWREALTPSPHNNMGMGCYVTNWHNKTRVNHNGGHAGFRTLHIHLLEDDFDVIFLSNSGYGSAREDLAEVIHTCFFGDDDTVNAEIKMDQGYAKT